jgi:hypothetical protein
VKRGLNTLPYVTVATLFLAAVATVDRQAPVLAQNGPKSLVTVSDNALLGMLSTEQYPAAYRLGFAAAGDGGGALFIAANAPCTLDSGGGDGGWQVKSADGKCWISDLGDRIAVPEIWGAPHDGTSDDGPAIRAMVAAASAGMPVNSLGFRCTNRSYVIKTRVTLFSPMRLSGCSQQSAPVLVRNSVTAINITASGVVLENLYLRGDRTAGQVGVNNLGSQNLIRNVRVELTDIGIQQGVGAGFLNRYERISGRNVKSYFLALEDGIGPVVDDIFYDTDGVWYSCDPCYPSPIGGGILLETEGTIIAHSDIIHGGAAGLLINANASHHANGPNWSEIGQGYFDSTDKGPGVLINNQSGGSVPIRGTHFMGTWMATGLNGLKTQTDGESTIDTVLCDGCQIHNNVYDGVLLTGNTFRVVFGDSIFANNDAPMPPGFGNKAAGAYANLNFQQTARTDGGLVVINGGYVGRADGWAHRPHYNLNAEANGATIAINGTYFDTAGTIDANINNRGPSKIRFHGQ